MIDLLMNLSLTSLKANGNPNTPAPIKEIKIFAIILAGLFEPAAPPPVDTVIATILCNFLNHGQVLTMTASATSHHSKVPSFCFRKTSFHVLLFETTCHVTTLVFLR